jgi:hypothetical protein
LYNTSVVLVIFYNCEISLSRVSRTKGEWRNWYTRATQNRVPYGLWVQVPPRPPENK